MQEKNSKFSETSPFGEVRRGYYCLLNGYDDIDFLLGMKDEIIEFENQHA